MDKGNMFSIKARNISFFATLSVVVIHAGGAGMGSLAAKVCHQFLGWGVCTFAVPWFFFVSGYYLAGHIGENGWWLRAVHKRIRTLLVPYMLWSIFFICLILALNVFKGMKFETVTGAADFSLYTLFIHGFGLDASMHPLLTPFWYVRALMIMVMFSPVLAWLLRKNWTCMLLALTVALIYCCGFHDKYQMPWFLFYSIFSLTGWLYFSLGILVRVHKNDLDSA